MMTAIKELYISKSFCMIGDTVKRCFNCGYCRHQDHGEFHYNTLPTEISWSLDHIPIVVNCFYGDPVLQWENTLSYLDRLETAEHRGPVIIITKGFLEYALRDLNKYENLDLHIALSTVGVECDVDKVSWKTFRANLAHLRKAPKVKYSCEFRPIMYGINDNQQVIDDVFQLCSDYNLPIGYSGLQGDPTTQSFWERNQINLKPFPGYKFTIKKPISEECADIVKTAAQKWNVPIFKKTSCLISYVHGFERDYNAHYYRPNEMGCDDCIMSRFCFYYKAGNDSKQTPLFELPFEFRLEHRDRHKCMLHDTCPHPHPDCTKINGTLIVIDEPVTTADVRVIKWLTGYTVAANFTESNFLSEKWRNFKPRYFAMAHNFLQSYGGNTQNK